MHKKTLVAATLAAALAIAGPAGMVAAQDEDEPLETLTGIVVAVVDEEGMTEYFLELADGTQVELSVGPPWYWQGDHPLIGLVGQEITVEGYREDAPDEAEESEDVAGVESPDFDVRTIDGVPLWDGERPPWAGGPAVVGEQHPGFEGWSKGQAARENGDEDEDVAVLAGGPKVVGESHPGYEGWSKGQAAKAAKGGGNRETGTSKAGSRRGGPKVVGESHPGHKGWSNGQAAKANGAAKAAAAKAKGRGGAPEEDGDRGRP